MTEKFKEETLLKIRREFSEKEKYNILMEDYFNMIKIIESYKLMEQKFIAYKEQHRQLAEKHSKLKNSIKNLNSKRYQIQ